MSSQCEQGQTERGVFITFEGGDGAGKSTHIRFLKALLEAHGREVLCLREPGGTYVGEQLRALVLDSNLTDLTPETELLLYEAARAQLTSTVIEPALNRGAVVLCDRFFDSTVAYQAYGRGLSLAFTQQANLFATKGLVPNRTIYLRASQAQTLKRMEERGQQTDRIEQAGALFHERVNRGFDALAAEEARIVTVESQEQKGDTARLVIAAVADLFPWLTDEVVSQVLEAYQF